MEKAETRQIHLPILPLESILPARKKRNERKLIVVVKATTGWNVSL
jgi:hypothetical protein